MSPALSSVHEALGTLRDWLEVTGSWIYAQQVKAKKSWMYWDGIDWLFNVLYDICWKLRQGVITIRDGFDDVEEWFDDLDLTGWIEDFFAGLPSPWSHFLKEPWTWLKAIIWDIDPTLYYWLVNPVLEVKTWFIKTVDNGLLLIDDPPKWVMWQLGVWWKGFANLYYNAPATVVEWLSDASPELDDFLSDMDGWVLERIEDWFDLPEGFSDDPVGWVFDTVKEKLTRRETTDMSWLYDFGEHLLRYFIEGVW